MMQLPKVSVCCMTQPTHLSGISNGWQGQSLVYLRDSLFADIMKKKKKLDCYDTREYFEATSICTSADGTVWASTPTGLLEKYDPATIIRLRIRCVLLIQHKSCIQMDRKIVCHHNGTILVGTSNQGAKFSIIQTSDL